jgi:endonuclease YncB( thermonuclease family)
MTTQRKFRVPYRSLLVTFVVALVAGIFWNPLRAKVLPQSSAHMNTSHVATVRVAGVIDGATLQIWVEPKTPGGKATRETLRLYGLNAPTVSHTPSLTASAARDSLAALCNPDSDIHFVSFGRDTTNALTGVVLLSDSRDVSQILIENGMVQTRFSAGDDSALRKKYEAAQQNARARRLGVWK